MRLPRSVVLIVALSKSGTGVGGRQDGCWAWEMPASATSAAAAIINVARLERSLGDGPGHADQIARLPAHTFLVRISATRIGGTHGFCAQPTPLRATCTSSR